MLVKTDMKKLKILFLTNIPSPYRVSFFNELGKLCDLTVLFEKASSAERDNVWKKYSFDNFNGIVLNGISTGVDNAFCFKVLKYLKMSWDRIVCADVSTPTGMLAIQYMKFHKIPYWIEGDGGFAKSGKGLKEKIKKYFISGAEGYFSTGSNHDTYYVTYGAEKERIFRYPFTSLTEEDVKKAGIKTKSEKESVRKKLNIVEDKVVLSVGRFSYNRGYGKGYDVLLKAAESFNKDIGIYIVGDEPTEEFILRKEKKQLTHIHFIGFKNKAELAEYYIASDLLAMPTRGDVWGLVVNEALSYGLPIVSSDKCVAALELIKDGVNGYIVPVEDCAALAEAINKVLTENYDSMSLAAYQSIQDYTIENMAKRHLEVLSKH